VTDQNSIMALVNYWNIGIEKEDDCSLKQCELFVL